MVNNLKLLIKSNFKTFISILLLTALGVGFLIGMKSSVPNLKRIVNSYFDKYNIFDLELTSGMGFTKDDVLEFSNISEIKKIEGSYKKDFVVKGNSDDYVLRVHSYNNDDDNINQLELIEGKLPKNVNEIVIEKLLYTKQEYQIGDIIKLDSELLNSAEYKIVGVIKSPLYLSSNKGSTNLLSGRVNYYAFINEENINSDIYSNLYIKLKNGTDISKVTEKIKDIGAKILDVRYASTIAEYQEKINAGQSEFDTKKAETEKKLKEYEEQIVNAELQIEAAEKSIPSVTEAKAILVQRQNELTKIKVQLDNAKVQIDNARKQYDVYKKAYDEFKKQFDSAQKELNDLKTKVTKENQKLKDENRALEQEYPTASEERKREIDLKISANNETIANNESNLNAAESFYNYYEVTMTQYGDQLKSAKEELDAKQQEYDLTYAEYKKAQDLLNANTPEEVIALYKKEVASKKKILNDKKKELGENKKRVLIEFEEYQNQLDDAKDYLKLISVNGWNIGERKDIASYGQYLSDIKRIENIGNFFPIIFYIVAVLITLTNISRIIANDRDKIGLYKALGYSNKSIGNNYIYFSLLACLLGSVLGTLIGIFIIPRIFYNVYNIIYYLPKFDYFVNLKIIVIAIVVAFALVIMSSYFSIKSTIKEWPAILFRPKENNKGKRVFIEKISLIWNHLNFTNKVTFRNMFKYPKRFIMTIIGIAGCISLIISGFNIKTSISNIIPLQFNHLFDIDVEVFFKDSLTRSEALNEKERINNLEEVDASILSYVKYVYLNDTESRANLVVPEDNDLLNDFVILESNSTKYELSDDGCIITKKIADIMNIKVGDIVKLKDSDNNVFEIKISAIVNNYVDNYIYMTKSYYNNILGSFPKYNALLVRTKGTIDEEKLSVKLNENNTLSYLVYTSTSQIMYNTLTKSLDYIVYVLVISAVILAFIVLYNLNSLNVEERKREIATIKVLGFYRKETYKYIENEIKRLTLIGIVIGLFLGYLFSNVLIKSCELDNLMYDYSINYLNYLYAILITIIFMIITSLLGRKNIKNINMIESLKKVE